MIANVLKFAQILSKNTFQNNSWFVNGH